MSLDCRAIRAQNISALTRSLTDVKLARWNCGQGVIIATRCDDERISTEMIQLLLHHSPGGITKRDRNIAIIQAVAKSHINIAKFLYSLGRNNTDSIIAYGPETREQQSQIRYIKQSIATYPSDDGDINNSRPAIVRAAAYGQPHFVNILLKMSVPLAVLEQAIQAAETARDAIPDKASAIALARVVTLADELLQKARTASEMGREDEANRLEATYFAYYRAREAAKTIEDREADKNRAFAIIKQLLASEETEDVQVKKATYNQIIAVLRQAHTIAAAATQARTAPARIMPATSRYRK